MLGFFKNHSESKGPYVMDITVNAALREALGFKTKTSVFYLISDQPVEGTEDLGEKGHCAEFLKKHPKFRGIYCDAGMENTTDIRLDLNRYCKLTNQFGLVMINGKEAIQSPESKIRDYRAKKELES